MKIKCDKGVDALFISFTEKKIVETSENKPGDIILDYDAAGSIVGIEVLNASQKIDNPAIIDYQEI